VADHPQIKHFRESGKKFPLPREMLEGAVSSGNPSKTGKEWDAFSARLRSVLVALAKVGRDDCVPDWETARLEHGILAVDLIQCLLRKSINKTFLPWEREEWWAGILERRRSRDDLHVYVFVCRDLDYSECQAVRDACVQHIKERIETERDNWHSAFTEHLPMINQEWTYKNNGGSTFEGSPIIIADPKSISDVMRRIPRAIQKKIRPPVHFRLPRDNRTVKVVNDHYDAPISDFLVVPLDHFPPSTRQILVNKRLRKRLPRAKIWRPNRHLRAVLIDNWSDIDSVKKAFGQVVPDFWRM